MSNNSLYRGRFAPSPSGDLHFGSLVAALGSYLDARYHHGKWFVRIEDIDPPREVAGATTSILHTLEQLGLEWDESVIYQSERHELYQHELNKLIGQGSCYGCDCTRKMIMKGGGLYQGNCAAKAPELLSTPHSVRFNNQNGIAHFDDRLMGRVSVDNEFATEDFILKRKDGLYAYQLVVVLDDLEQGITDVVRGRDLLEVTTRQMSLYQHLNHPFVRYLHLPLAINSRGTKLSKQSHAPAIVFNGMDLDAKKALLLNALSFLGQKISHQYQDFTIEQLLKNAAKHWRINDIAKADQLISF